MLWRMYRHAEERLVGWPDEALTAILLLAALVLILIALKGSPVVKAFAAVYVFFP